MNPGLLLGVVLLSAVAHADPPPEGAEMMRIMQKMQTGQPLTPEEKEFLKAMHGGPPGPGGPGAPTGALTLQTLGVCPTKVVPLSRAAPTKAAYLAAVDQVAGEMATKDPKAAKAIDAAVAGSSDPWTGMQVAPAFVAKSSGAAALYAAAATAKKLPDDAVVAASLGAMLTAAGRLPQADIATAWALARAPGLGLAETNRGWLAYTAGAKDEAKTRFQSVIRSDADAPGAHLGLGLLAACSGDDEAAEKEIRQSLEERRSKVAVLAMLAVTPGDPEPWRSDAPANLIEPLIGADVAASAKLQPQAAADVQQLDGTHTAWAARSQTRLGELKKAFEADGNAFEDNGMFDQVRTPYVDAVDRETRAHNQEMVPLLERWAKEGPIGTLDELLARTGACGGDSRCVKQVQYEHCLGQKALGEELNTQFRTEIAANWETGRPAIEDLWAVSAGSIEHFHSPAWAAVRAEELEHQVIFANLQYVQTAATWDLIAQGIAKMECVPPPPPPPPPGPSKPLPDVDPDDNLCALIDDMGFSSGVITWALSCEELKITASGANQEASLTDNLLTNELTMFWGVTGEAGPASGKVGPYVTYNDRITGVGMAAEGEVGLGPLGSVEGGAKLGMVAVEGGAPYDFQRMSKTWGPGG